MKQKHVFAIVAVIAALALAGLACGGGAAPTETPVRATKAPAPTATQAPKPTAKPTQAIAAGELVVVNQFLFKDSTGYFHVVGEVHNDTEKALTDIELTVEVKDKDGQTLLKDSSDSPADTQTFSPLLYTLGPGETSPYDYYFFTEAGEPDQYAVTVTGQHTGEVNRANLKVENAQLSSDGSGSLYLTGELVNQGDKPVQIHSLAGAVLDKDNSLVAANAYGPVSRYLLPAGDANQYDRTPFRVRIDDPGDVATQWATYWDADEVDPIDTYDINLDPQNNYFDTYSSLHLVGNVTNNSDQTLSISLLAGLYADDGIVLDADTWTAPFYLAPGESLPYSFDYFSSLNRNPDEANKASRSTVQVDPYWTSTTSFEFVPLETQNDEGGLDGDEQDQIWKFSGEVTNTSDKDLSSLLVVVGVYDGDNLVATNWTSVYPPEGQDTVAASDTVPYEVSVYLDPKEDGTKFTFQTFVQGNVQP
jgi:hypothetical protein